MKHSLAQSGRKRAPSDVGKEDHGDFESSETNGVAQYSHLQTQDRELMQGRLEVVDAVSDDQSSVGIRGRSIVDIERLARGIKANLVDDSVETFSLNRVL